MICCFLSGAEDSHGYFEGEVKGRVGLVPALYLQPHTGSRTPTHKHKNMQVTNVNNSSLILAILLSWL